GALCTLSLPPLTTCRDPRSCPRLSHLQSEQICFLLPKEACPQESSRPQHCRALRSVQPYAEDLVLARRQVRRCCNGSSLQQNFGSQESRRGSPWAAAAGQRGPSKNGPSCCALRDHLALAPPWCREYRRAR